jgi:hypothetical protein
VLPQSAKHEFLPIICIFFCAAKAVKAIECQAEPDTLEISKVYSRPSADDVQPAFGFTSVPPTKVNRTFPRSSTVILFIFASFTWPALQIAEKATENNAARIVLLTKSPLILKFLSYNAQLNAKAFFSLSQLELFVMCGYPKM